MNLTATAKFFKRGILVTIIFIFLSFASFIGYQIWHAHYLASLPPVEEKPDLKFGNLPSPDLPENPTSSTANYTLDTNTGGLPDFGKIIKVYFIPKPTATLLASQRARDFAFKLGFIDKPNILSETKYQYSTGNKSLNLNLDTGNFKYESTASAVATIPDEVALVAGFKSTLSNLGVMREELNTGFGKTTFQRGSSFAFISLFPQRVDDKPILTPNFKDGLVYAKVSGPSDDINNYSLINFFFWPVDLKTYATYPLKTASQAFEELKSGQGAEIISNSSEQVSITSIYLAYYESENYLSYLHPIYVFEGPGFVAFVPALDRAYLTTGATQNF